MKNNKELQDSIQELNVKEGIVNTKIAELGNYIYSLNTVLSIMQTQIAKIRHLPNNNLLKYKESESTLYNWKRQVEIIQGDLVDNLSKNINQGILGISLGVGFATLGRTVAMDIATIFGRTYGGVAISSYSGVVANNLARSWIGGGSLAAGDALLSLTSPIGWIITGLAVAESGIRYWFDYSEKKRLNNILSAICYRVLKTYDLAQVELEERIHSIDKNTIFLESAIVKIGEFGDEYSKMTEEQQYELGSYVNLLWSSVQLLNKPIMALQPKITEKDINKYYDSRMNERNKSIRVDAILFLSNMLYDVSIDKHDRKLLTKYIKRNKKLLEQMKLEKNDINISLFETINNIISQKKLSKN